ncbi:hypothetical protein SLINC_5386 [Streptomyces lincolnensis]|uniref:Uncharacterized protein n=1 Tax=Streptomyces lincolnensis TaxID=1915 RepID=A0A1B1MG52_STRLN|nr:hypothetical protein [Streptomyces lincolnensis]ANS67610.1 hypothetical protein SLINC_5386 [Streptomyces lincolnensis]AXG54925.1 hypothetical protein SLCG_3770 [Streptomyces lincolnensis]QMV09276.1 hypothetical protein GJU35_28930 [Streptomyces lincolnensis]
MSAGGDGKDIKAHGLDGIARGINLTLGELKELGVDSFAGQGRGFANLALSGLELGHEDLQSALASFCERWEWGVRALVEEGNLFAHQVGLAAGTLHETDQYVDGMLKVAANSVAGNPYLSEDEAAKQSWGDIATSGLESMKNPDYSKESFEQAWDTSAQGWKDVQRDALTSQMMAGPIPSPLNIQESTGASDEQYEALVDEVAGPSPEERAQAAGQQPDQDANDTGTGTATGESR